MSHYGNSIGVDLFMREIDDETPNVREYTASALCYVAGCELETFKAWRRRNGLFPETKKAGSWSRFSLADMSAAKVVVDLTRSGVSAQRAVDIAMKLLPVIEKRSASKPSDDDPNWSPPKTREEADDLMAQWCAVNYIVRGNARGGFTLTRYDKAMTVAELLEAEGHSAGLILINLANVMDLSIDRLSRLRDDEIDPLPAKSTKRPSATPNKSASKERATAAKKKTSPKYPRSNTGKR